MNLAVNIDHVATVREARGGIEPDPVHAAVLAELAGASGIVCHLREDRRHVNDRDVRTLRDVLTTKLDLEMAATPEIISIALDIEPDLVTLVPEKRQERTTEGGLDILALEGYFTEVVQMFSERSIEVSLFVEPEVDHVQAAARTGCTVIELHTGLYANARRQADIDRQLIRIRGAAEAATDLGLTVTAGHGLHLRNLPAIARIPQIAEVSIGHALIGHALFVGMQQAVRDYLSVLRLS